MLETAQTLVLGGTGKSGRRLVHRLRAVNRSVRVGSTSGTPPFDWTDPETWAAALDGINAVFVVYSPDVAMPGAPDVIGAFAEQAVAAGARRLVMLSGQRAEFGLDSERRLQDSGAEWTILRVAWFDQNFDEGFLLDDVRAGQVALPVGSVGEAFIDADDIAEVAATVLTEPRHSGAIYELTGPRLLTFADAVAEISAAAGRDIRFVEVPPDTYAATLTAHGVQKILGREPRDFADYARAAAATGVWAPN
jgi:uncharacterized protein YbjT (DUF2867 family)